MNPDPRADHRMSVCPSVEERGPRERAGATPIPIAEAYAPPLSAGGQLPV
jgi:hypothetical protein